MDRGLPVIVFISLFSHSNPFKYQVLSRETNFTVDSNILIRCDGINPISLGMILWW